MSNQPVIEFRNATAPNAVIASLTLQGTGFNNAIPVGGQSTPVTIRIYNNFANTAGIHDAINCVLASYDDATHQGSAASTPVSQLWLNVQVLDFNGLTGSADTNYVPIGGATKHAVPVNNGTIPGATSNYIEVNLMVVIPATASSNSVTQGLWLEYSWT